MSYFLIKNAYKNTGKCINYIRGDKVASFKEIVTKAVIGKAKKTNSQEKKQEEKSPVIIRRAVIIEDEEAEKYEELKRKFYGKEITDKEINDNYLI